MWTPFEASEARCETSRYTTEHYYLSPFMETGNPDEGDGDVNPDGADGHDGPAATARLTSVIGKRKRENNTKKTTIY